MAEVASAYVSLLPSAKGWGKQVDQQVSPELDKAGKSSGSRLSGAISGVLKKTLKTGGLVIGGVLGAALFKGFSRLSAIDDAKAKLLGLGNSARTVDTIMTNALTSVKGTAFGLGDAATVAAGAVTSGIKPGKALTANLKLVADAATIAGVPLNEMGAIFNKVAASGKLQGDVIAQLGDKGIPILQLLGKQIGQTPAEVSKLASEGKIDFETFSKAMQGGLGGAAQKSGNTFKGAMANVGAALGRVGAALLTGLFPIAKQVFGSMTSLLDKATTAIGPFAEKVTAAVVGISDILLRGDFTSAFGKAFGFAEDSKPIDYLFRLREGIIGLFDLVAKGDFTTAFRSAFHLSEDSSAVNLILNLRSAIGGFVTSVIAAAKTAGPPLLRITKALLPLGKIALGSALIGMTLAFKVLGAAVRIVANVLAGLVDLVASNQTTFKVLTAIVGAALLPVLIQMAATLAFNATGLAALTVATVAYNTVTKIMAAGARIAAAAQWLLNVALSANPIGLIIIALIALGAGLVLLWKKSDTFRAIVTGAFNAVMTAVDAVVGFIKKHWPLLLAILTGPIGIATLLVVKNFDKIKAAGTSVVNWVKAIPGKLAGLAAKFGGAGKTLIQAFINGLSKAGGMAADFASSIWNAVKSAINKGIDKLNGLLDFKVSIKGAPDIHVNAPNIGHLARGTDNWRGGPSWVGENGPEILNIPRGSQVIPNHKIGPAASAMPGTVSLTRESIDLLADSILAGAQRVSDGTLRTAQRSAAGTRQTAGVVR